MGALMQVRNVDGVLDLTPIVTSQTVCVTGSIMAFGGEEAPDGWLICNGSEVSRKKYAALFSVIKEHYGSGDGETTFNLPDLRESTLKGVGLTGNSTAHVNKTGLKLGEFIDDRVQTHTHAQHRSDREGLCGLGTDNDNAKRNYTVDSGENSGRRGPTTEVKAVGVNFIIKY